MGSMSHSVMSMASCPVMIVAQPQLRQVGDLTSWYEAALKEMLQNHPTTLVNITAHDVHDVTKRFPPPHLQVSGKQERLAASQALERLESSKLLYRHDVGGEIHYHND
jgi:hypothetical protein